MPEQTCGTCRHGIGWTMTKHTPPRINKNERGWCLWDAGTKQWPISIATPDRKMPPKMRPWADWKDCPCWEAKPCKS
jgi:hypothetical protein